MRNVFKSTLKVNLSSIIFGVLVILICIINTGIINQARTSYWQFLEV